MTTVGSWSHFHKELTSMLKHTESVSSSNIGNSLHSAFTAHPAAVGESYFQHQRKAFGFAWNLAITAMAAAVHAIVPALCVSTARNRIETLHSELQHRSSTKPHS